MNNEEIKLEPDESHETAWAMERYGGNFVKALAKAIGVINEGILVKALSLAIEMADLGNTKKIKQAFREYWDIYHEIGKKEHELLKQHAGEHHCLECGTFFPIKEGQFVCPDCGSDNWQDVDGSLPKNRD